MITTRAPDGANKLEKHKKVENVKGIVHKKNSLLKSHILGYDGVWYSSFWSEGSGNQPN